MQYLQGPEFGLPGCTTHRRQGPAQTELLVSDMKRCLNNPRRTSRVEPDD